MSPIRRLSLAAIASTSLLSCTSPPPSPYVEVFGGTVARMAAEYRDVVGRTAMIEQHAATLRTSALESPHPADYEIRDSIEPFLLARTELLGLLTSYANLLSAIVLGEESDVIVQCIELVTSANTLEERYRETIHGTFVEIATYAADGFEPLNRGSLIAEVMLRAQPAIDETARSLTDGQEGLTEQLRLLTGRLHNDVLSIRSSGRLSWTERERLDELTFEVMRTGGEIRADLARLDAAVEKLSELHRLVAENVYNIPAAEQIITRLSPFGRRPDVSPAEPMALPSSYREQMRKGK